MKVFTNSISICLLVCLFFSLAFSKDETAKGNSACEEILNHKESLLLKGSLIINSKGEFILHPTPPLKNNPLAHRKIVLKPCSESLKKYLYDSWDSYAYLRNPVDEFWISVYGHFISAPQSSDSTTPPLYFLFESGSLLGADEMDVRHN